MRYEAFRRAVRVGALLGALLLSAAIGHAWASRAQSAMEPVDPRMLSGADIGFRMVGRKADAAVGVWMVRVDGKWVPTASTGRVTQAK